MTKWGLAILVLVVILLHQDFWLWTDKTLLFDFLPIGLAYQAGFSILAAVTMALVVRYAWPSELEATAYPVEDRRPEQAV
jgi:hypothetical protein